MQQNWCPTWGFCGGNSGLNIWNKTSGGSTRRFELIHGQVPIVLTSGEFNQSELIHDCPNELHKT